MISRRKFIRSAAAGALFIPAAPAIIQPAKAWLAQSSGVIGPNPWTLFAHVISSDSDTTPTLDATGATFAVAVVSYYTGGGAGILTTRDAYSQVYTLVASYEVSGDAGVAIYFLPPGSTFSTGYFAQIVPIGSPFSVIELSLWTGAAATPLDQHSGFASAAVSTIQAGSVTPSVGNQLIIAGVAAQNGTASITSVNGGFTVLDKAAQDSGQIAGGAAYLIQNTPAAVNPTWTLGGSSAAAAALATFKSP